MDANRRGFLKNSLAAVSAAPLFVPRKAWGANDRITYGVIGAGGRGVYVSQVFQKLGAECVAICDVYEPNIQRALKNAPGAKTYVDYNDLLAQEGIDAVLIATPDHQHYPNLMAALKAGKDVYLEKPMSHSIEESRKMVEAVRKSKQIVQIGMQRRSAEMVLKAKQKIDEGVLGKISMVKPVWNWNTARPLNNSPLEGKIDWKRFCGPAKREFQPMCFRSWRLFWEFSGGNMTDQGTHLMDVTQWFTGTESGPLSAICYGQIQKTTGSEVPDVFCAVFEYPQHMVTWTLNYCNSYHNGWSILFQGDKGTMLMDEAGCRIWAEPSTRPENREPIYEDRAGIPVEAHVQNFLDCCRTRKEPNAPVEVGASAVSGPHLANIAFKQRRQVRMSEV
mgnify:CR=1 FL=1